jgi:hypothetical protein
MAVELRCPECKAKLRLPVAPEPDSEIECPKCEHVFPCEENIVHAGAADEDDQPRKKKTGDADDEPKKKPEDASKGSGVPNEAPKGGKRKRRKSKKRKTRSGVLVAIIAGAVLLIAFVAGALIWFFTKKSASQEMISYLPDECDEVWGINLGQLQKYPEFYKTCEGLISGTGFKRAGESVARALGDDTGTFVEYVVQGSGNSGGTPLEATVLKTKAEFDPGLLKGMAGAREGTLEGVTYYRISDPGLGYPGARVFAPTNRLVVITRDDIPEAKFKAMITGNRDGENPYKKGGPMARQVIRGTAWRYMLYSGAGGKVRPLQAPAAAQGGQAGGSESDDDAIRKEVAEILSSAQGCGVKASVGSREVRCEFIVWYKDSEAASNQLKKWKEKDWVKDEEKEPPKWWKTLAGKTGAGKTAPNVIRDGLAFRSSGETFTIRSSMETKLLQGGVNGLVGIVSATQTPGTFGGGPPGGFGGPPRPGGGGGGGPRRRRPVRVGAIRRMTRT